MVSRPNIVKDMSRAIYWEDAGSIPAGLNSAKRSLFFFFLFLVESSPVLFLWAYGEMVSPLKDLIDLPV